MWTAKLINKLFKINGVEIIVQYSNGTEVVEKTHIFNGGDIQNIKQTVKNEINNLTKNEALQASLTLNATIEPATEVVLTQEEIDRAEFLKNYNKWVTIKKNLIDTGVLTGNETQVVNFLNKVKADFKPDYINYI